MPATTLHTRIRCCYDRARDLLLAERTAAGHWVGELSTSPLATATAVVALEIVRRQGIARDARLPSLIDRGLRFLANHQNQDGGWGDTLKSISNISTTMLSHAAFHATESTDCYQTVVARAAKYIDRAGGVAAVRARYGKDHTFSVPILTHCALAGLVDWKEIAPLPFQLAVLPPQLFKFLKLPVVSYALPALIAIGQCQFHHGGTINPLTWLVKSATRTSSLSVLKKIQPGSGGFLEAAPLTAFVTMSLASIGLADHPVARRGVDFLAESVRPDGSWPIDTNLATWVTTLSVNALGADLPPDARTPIRNWLLDQQYTRVHPYTNAAPGGWAWTDLPGGVPDADDTPGALLALRHLGVTRDATLAAQRAIVWLLDLQNGDGGWPTFCRGWGFLPFDRSAPDLTAHCLRALWAWREDFLPADSLRVRLDRALRRGRKYLDDVQRADGSWLPLWFGNQHVADDENPTYGTTRVLAAYRDLGGFETLSARRGLNSLVNAQNRDGGFGGGSKTESTVEETALAIEVLLSDSESQPQAIAGLDWLMDRIEKDEMVEPAPIGFYFAKLWYFERLYPIIFSVAALSQACRPLPTDHRMQHGGDLAGSVPHHHP